MIKLDKSKDVNFIQLENIDAIFVTIDVSNLVTSKVVMLWHPLNMPPISKHDDVLKLVTSIVNRLIQPSKNDSNFVTFEVSKFEISRQVKDLQFLNILFIFFALVVLKLETSMDVKEIHPLNISE